VGRVIGKAPRLERALTSVMQIGTPHRSPVFVDPSGTRRRRVRRTAYAIGVLLVLALLAFWLNQLIGSVRPSTDRPCPSVRPSAAVGDARACR
jgi:hypothetical protein